VFYHPQYLGKGAIRLYVSNEFQDEFGKVEFFTYRKKKVEPSKIPDNVTKEAVHWMFAQPDDKVFKLDWIPDYKFVPVRGSFNKVKCSKCDEYVFERYLRQMDGNPVCIPCSHY
jgi:formylmethanofuran dehydrogenase subunit E